jgi:hypothetical protein
MGHYEEYREASPRAGWAIIVALSAALLAFGLLCFSLIKDRQRSWSFGALPDVPAESIYSSAPTPLAGTAPRQFVALPEAKPWVPDGGQP